MKRKLKFLTQLGLLLIFGALAHAQGAPEDTSSAFMFKIPELKLENASVQDAVNAVLEQFRARYPDDQGIRGIVVSVPDSNGFRITMDMKEVPVGVALTYIAQSVWGTITENNGVIHIIAPTPSKVGVRDVIAVSDRAQRLLAITSSTTKQELIALVDRLGVKGGLIDKIEYNSNIDAIFVEGYVDEVNLLRAIFELIARGVDIPLKKNAPE